MVLGCSEGSIRLVGGAIFTEGRVEICLNDEWGTVCDQMWDVADARVVCRQLGLPFSGSYGHILLSTKSCTISCIIVVETLNAGATFGEGTGRIWLDSVQCRGGEEELINCTASSNGVNSCTHAQDAGVRCPLGVY